MRKYAFAIRVSIIMTALITLIGFMTFYAYERFSSTVNEMRNNIRPDQRLVTSKSLLNSLNNAELNVKSFRITDDPSYLSNFYTSVQNVETDLANFHEFTNTIEEESITPPLDSLDNLIDLKIAILNELLFLQDGIRTQKALDQVVEKIEASSETDTIIHNIEQTSEEEKKRRFEWLFKNKKKPEETKDSIIPVEIVRVEQINQDLSSIRKKEKRYTRAYKEKEIELILKDEAISQLISSFFTAFEIEEQKRLQQNSLLIEARINETNQQIAWLCLVAALLLILMAIVIISYVKKNKNYQTILQRAKQDAEHLTEAKQTFLANMTHEIRTPLNAIIGFSEQIGTSPLDAQQQKYLEMVQKSSDHLLHVVNEILDFSKLEKKKIKLENINFSTIELFSEIKEYLHVSLVNSAVNYEIEIDSTIPSHLIGDVFRLRQILYNLLSNSLKFTSKGTIKLVISTLKKTEKKHSINFMVTDTGIGIAEENMRKIFDDFEQANANTSKNYGGTGLGLSIVKSLIELQNGHLQIKSKPQFGTTFEFQLTYEIGKPETKKHPISPIKFFNDNARVLIVDDEEFNRMLLKTILNKHNFEIDQAVNGLDAFEQIQEHTYDLILTDIRMPILTGTELLQKIRTLTTLSNNKTPVIALTAATTKQDIENYEKLGFNAVLSKPFNEQQLLNLIEQFIPSISNENKTLDDSTRLDFESLKEISGDDLKFYTEMLQTFIKGTEKGVLEITKYIEDENFAQAAETAHRISTPCNHLGAKQLYSTLKRIENEYRQTNSVSNTTAILALLQTSTLSALKQAREELNKHS